MSNGVIVGAHPWVYAAKRPKWDIYPILDEIFKDMRSAELEGIELMDSVLIHDDSVERIGALSEKYELPVIGMSFGGKMWDRESYSDIMTQAGIVIPRLAQVGGRTLGVSVGGTPEPKTPEQFDAQAEVLRNLISLCEAHGVVLNLHNHTYEVKDDMHDLLGTMERIPDVKLGPDLNWLVRGGVDPVAFIKRFGESIVFIHLRDQHADGSWSEALGEGDTDHTAIGQALKDISFKGEVVIELAHKRSFKLTRSLGENLAQSRAFVKSALGY